MAGLGRWVVSDKRFRRGLCGAAAIACLALAAGPVRASDIDDIKEMQKKILERLDAQDRTLRDILQKIQSPPAQAGRPQIDPNKVYTIAVAASPIRGPKEAPVTLVEFSDYQ